MNIQIIFAQNLHNTERATDKPVFGTEKYFFKHNTSGLQSNFKPISVECDTIGKGVNEICKDFFNQISTYKGYVHNGYTNLTLKHKWQKSNFIEIRKKNKLAKSVCNGLNKANSLLINKELCEKLLNFYQKYSPINIVWNETKGLYEPYEILSEIKEGYSQPYGKGINFNENFYIHITIDGKSTNVHEKSTLIEHKHKRKPLKNFIQNSDGTFSTYETLLKANRLYLPNLEAKNKREFAKGVYEYVSNVHKLLFPLEYLGVK